MGRELQKKKNRSSIPKVKQKPKSKRLHVLGNATVAANWDQNLTLSQNYRQLGLTSKLNARTGGTESFGHQVEHNLQTAVQAKDRLSVTSKLPTSIVLSEARIERDPTTGAILRVFHPHTTTLNPLDDPLNEILEVYNDDKLPGHLVGGIIPELEEQASMKVKKRPRQQSKREEHWISDLVTKYGEDFSHMVRDRKLNPYQQSEGDLRRRVRTWKENRN
ncbi:Nucleolar protein 16 [Xylographa soralifera]|nr:Nucleolar protein 16 [Xylographa soralifera]